MGWFTVVCVAECQCALTRSCCGCLVQPVPIASVCQCVEKRGQPPVAKATFQMQLFHRLKFDSCVLLLVQPTKWQINPLKPRIFWGKKMWFLYQLGIVVHRMFALIPLNSLSPLMGLQTWLCS